MSEQTIETVKKINIPELLAPAGGWEQLEAAVNNGADAVYMGGPLFNARMKADNFSGNRIKDAVDFAHRYRVKVYITLNTLIRESELQKAFEYACDLYEAGADAVILQDMGLARLIKSYLPDFPMHLSTQGTVYNRSGLEMAARLGFSRVVPAREMSLDEIRKLCGKDVQKVGKAAEVEVFAHGALCMCYSGQCQMSRILGGGSARSGNRGLCAQPCRLKYEDEKGRLSYALSPKDICTIEDIPALCEAGVDSLKIEGRLKSAEYVATVTRIYRKYLNLYAFIANQQKVFEKGSSKKEMTGEAKAIYEISPEDMRELLQIFNRGGFTKGYLYGNPKADILSGKSPKNMGIHVGEVVSARRIEGKSKGNSSREEHYLVDVKLLRSKLTGIRETINYGDGVEMSGTGNVVTYVERISDDIVRIGDFRIKWNGSKGNGKGHRANKRNDSYAEDKIISVISKGDKVYRVTDRKLSDKALIDFAPPDTEISMIFSAKIGEQPKLIAKADGKCFKIYGDTVIAKALKHPADAERIRRQLSKLGGTPFYAADITVNADVDAMVPVSVINNMRRRAVEDVIAERISTDRKPVNSKIRTEALNCINSASNNGVMPNTKGGVLNDKAGTADSISEISGNKNRIATENSSVYSDENSLVLIPLEKFMVEVESNARNNADVAVGADAERKIPYVINVTKGNTDKYIETHFNEIVDAVKDTGILLGNLGWIREFRNAGIRVFGDYGLNVFNSQAEMLFNENGVHILCRSDEMSKDGFHCTISTGGMKKAPERRPICMNRIPLMITEHPLRTDFLVDRKGVRHEVLKWYSGDKYLIF